MKRMILHWSPRSPFVRKVMIAAHEQGLAERIDCVRTVVGGTVNNAALMRLNPLGKLPTLELSDGTVLYDSAVICEYFDTIGSVRLIPVGAERLGALRRAALGDGVLDIGLMALGERGRPVERQSEAHMTLWREKRAAAVAAMEGEAAAMAAGAFDIGQLCLGVALGYLDFRFGNEPWRDGHPALAAWYAGFQARPSAQANLPRDDS